MTRVWTVLLLLVVGLAAGTPVAAQTKMAMILPGPVEDGDFNALGYHALKAVGQAHKMEVSHSEKVAVADAERVAREYATSGFKIIAFHGGQFLTMMQKPPRALGLPYERESRI
jgi:basic membrane lipoprotein Med (substrate-binding protein (PBP1-ABC) superfamily)